MAPLILKYIKMKIVINNQIEHEHKACRRSLEFFKQENALLKYRLSEIVDSNEESGFLQLAEYFQNELLLKDEKLNKLINELHQISDQFRELENFKGMPEKLLLIQDQFRRDMLDFENSFLLLSKDFNKKMLTSN